jgi:hypothetical protein
MAAREAGRRVEVELRGGQWPTTTRPAPREAEPVAAVLRQET